MRPTADTYMDSDDADLFVTVWLCVDTFFGPNCLHCLCIYPCECACYIWDQCSRRMWDELSCCLMRQAVPEQVQAPAIPEQVVIIQ